MPATVEFPDDLTIQLTRAYEAPLQLVFDAMTRTEHVLNTIAPYDEEVRECSIDLRVGGGYRYVFAADDGTDMVFHGTFLEVDPPRRIAQTWLFDGWPGLEALESMDFAEAAGATTLTYRLRFRSAEERARMRRTDGLEANFENVARYLATLAG